MDRNPQQPSPDRIQRSCRSLQRTWSSSERRRRELAAAARQRHLVQVLCGPLRNSAD